MVRLMVELQSVGMNVAGVGWIVALARKMNHLEVLARSTMTIIIFLQAMVDVSTAYCNCDLAHIEEKIYEAPGNPRGMIELCKVAPSLILPPTLPPSGWTLRS